MSEVMYVVEGEGLDSFIAEGKGGIYEGMADQYGGDGLILRNGDNFKIEWRDNCDTPLDLIAYKSKVYR